MMSALTFSAGTQKNPSLSAASSLTRIIIRPWRRSSRASSILEMGMVVPKWRRALKLIFSSLVNEVTNVLADQICFDIDFITNPKGAQISVLQSKWDDRDAEPSGAASVHSQADSINGNRPFGDQQ